jgi:hypothetical protein
MRTAIILLAGFVLWGLCLGAAKIAIGDRPSWALPATIAFIALWFGVAAWNMWKGVTRAGYSVAEELPIFFLIFLVPVVIALIVKWRLL